MSSSSFGSDHGPSGSSSVHSHTLQTPGLPQALSVPPSTYGGLLSRILSKNALRQAVIEAAADLQDCFHNAVRPPPEASFRSSWNNLARTALPQQWKTYQQIKLMFRASDEVSLLDLRVANGPSFGSIDFNQMVMKAEEDGKRVRAVQRHRHGQPTTADTAAPTAPSDTELLGRYDITENTPMLPPMPDRHSRASSFTPSTGTGEGASTTAGINTPDGGMILQRNVQSGMPITVGSLASLTPEQHTQLILMVSEVKVRAKARLGLAQSLSYLVSCNKGCGTWMCFLCVDLNFVRIAAISDTDFAMETEDPELMGQTLSPWALFERFRNDYFQPIIHSIQDQARCHLFADTIFELRAIGAVIPTDQPLSRLPHPPELGSWNDVRSRASRTPVASAQEQLYLASEARRDTIGRIYHHIRQTMMNRTATSAGGSTARPRRPHGSSDEDGGSGEGRRQKSSSGKRATKVRGEASAAEPKTSGRGSGSGSRRRRPVRNEQPAEDSTTLDTLSSLALSDEVDEADFLVAALLHHGLRVTLVSPSEMCTMIQERARDTVRLIQKASGSANRSTVKQASHALATSVGVELS